jgi:hypothetical protein
MSNAIENFVRSVEKRVEALWSDLSPHVVPEAEADAKQALASAKADLGQLAISAGQDVHEEAAAVVKSADEVARDAAQALGTPINDLPAADRPATAAELATAAGHDGEDTTEVTVPADVTATPSEPAGDQSTGLAADPEPAAVPAS